MQVAGIPGYLSNMAEHYEQADSEGAAWRDIVSLWAERYGAKEVGVAALYPLAEELSVLDLGTGGDKSRRTRFGTLLSRRRGMVIAGYRIASAGTRKRLSQYMLIPQCVE